MADSDKASSASAAQSSLIAKITNHTPLKISADALNSIATASAWIDLALFSCSDGELSKIGKQRPNKSPTVVAQHVATISRITELPAPADHSQPAIRQWFEAIAKTVKLPPVNKLLQYWSRALAYRDLNALALESAPPITESITPATLPQFLPKLVEGFQPPKSGSPGDPVALMIASTVGADPSKAKVLLGIPLACDRATKALAAPPQGAVPFFNREWLEPPDSDAVKDLYLGNVEDCDEFFSSVPPPANASWPEYWLYIEKFVETVTGAQGQLPNLAAAVTGKNTFWKVVNWDTKGASKKIADTYQEAMKKLPPLLNTICNKPEQKHHIDLDVALKLSSHLLGHIDTYERKRGARVGFHLEQSQRIAATAMTHVKSGKMLAVNGPPGTGKTSFLRAVIGTSYVRDAVNAAQPSIILATAATNKAVTNIIESFGEIAGPEMQPDWSSRWLPDLPSYGWFYPASSRQDAELEQYMVLRREYDAKPPRLVKQAAAQKFFDREQQQRQWMRDGYLNLHRQVLGLPTNASSPIEAAQMIQSSLRQSVIKMNKLQVDWAACLSYPQTHEAFSYHQDQWQQLLDKESETQKRLEVEVADVSSRLSAWGDVLSALRAATELEARRYSVLYRIRSWVFGDTLGQRCSALTNHALAGMAALDPSISLNRVTALNAAGLRHEELVQRLAEAKQQQLNNNRNLDHAREMLSHWKEWRTQIETICRELPNEGDALRRTLEAWAGEKFPVKPELKLVFEEALDKAYRFKHFHMAARYWEARWLADMPTPEDAGNIKKALVRAAMLAPVIVSTVYTLPGILDEFEFADILIFDESGQASPEIGAASFAYAKRAIVVGDIHQLQPVWNVGTEADRRLLNEVEIDELDQGFSASSGSVMKIAQAHTAFTDMPPRPQAEGIGLVAHYRCRREIIDYCRELIYHDALKPVRLERPPNGQRHFLYPPMAWVAVEKRTGASKKSSSWVNDDEVAEIVRWLRHEHQRITNYYGVKRISDAVALIAPFRAQAMALRKAVARELGAEEAQAMVIDTVHALQGAEKPIVAFSLTQDAAPFFVERVGPNLLNVAVSRAQDCFILFAAPAVIAPPTATGKASPTTNSKGTLALKLLVSYTGRVGKRLYPREVVVIEAPGKVDRITEALGLSAKVIATGGHFRRLALVGGKLVAEYLKDGDVARGKLEDETRDLKQVDAFYLATDDDDDGEEIAWHVQEVLRERGVDSADRVRRMRFYALTPDEIRRARELALPGIDAKRVRANVFRSIFDAQLHKQLVAKGVRATRPQLALLNEIAQRQTEHGHWRVRVTATINNQTVAGYLLPKGSQSPVKYSSKLNAEIGGAQVGQMNAPQIAPATWRELRLPRYPAATTAQTLISAYRRYGWSPGQTAVALQQLYLGRTTPKAYGVGEPEPP
jgi:hypothetical protein